MGLALYRQHSPGPWRMTPNGAFVQSSDGAIVAWALKDMVDNRAANQQLILAAPDLLEALRVFAGLYDNQQNGLEVLPSDWAIMRKVAGEAIQSATGEDTP